jgi:hypothetical protein
MPNINLVGLYKSSAEWVDYDSDGDLDLFMTGLDFNNIQRILLYKNESGVKQNLKPSSPENLITEDLGNGFVKFKWKQAADDHSQSLGYNLRIGTTPSGTELSNTQSDLISGTRLLTIPPSIYDTTFTIQLNPGNYYWSVCFAPLNNRTQFQNYFCNYVYGKEELFKTGEIKDSQRGIRKRLETYSGKVQFVSYYLLLLETEVFCIR